MKRYRRRFMLAAVLFCMAALSGCEQAGGTAAPVTEPDGQPQPKGEMLLSVTVPAGVTLDGAKSRFRVETVPPDEAEPVLMHERAVTGSLNRLALRLPAGVYTVDVLLVSTDGKRYAEALEAEITVPDADSQDRPAVPELKFEPDAGALVSEEEEQSQNLTGAVQVKLTKDNTGNLSIVQAGGSGAARTRGMATLYGINTVSFVIVKKTGQTLTAGGESGTLVSMAEGPTDGETPGPGRAVLIVDTSGISAGGSMTFVITVSEPGKNSIAYTFTIQTPVLVSLHVSFNYLIDDFAGEDTSFYYYKHTYRVGEPFDHDSIGIGGKYIDGSSRWETVYEVEGFDSSSAGTCTVRFRKGDVYATIDGYPSVKLNIIELSPPRLFFDYGRRISSADAVPGRYTVTEGSKLVIAPVLWHIPEGATFDWNVSGGVYETNGDFLTFKPGTAAGNYTATVTASFGGTQVSASTTVECVNASSPASASTVTGMAALAQSAGEHRGWNTSLGGYGGYLIKKLRVINNSGYDFCINGNAFGNWAEPGIVWVMKDENGNGAADDTWYELKGSGDGWGIVTRRYAVTFYKPPAQADSILPGGWWEDSLGNWSSFENRYYDKNWPDNITFAGTAILDFKDHFGSTFWGYADVLDNRFDIANAIHADGTAKGFDYIDFIRVQTAQNRNTDLFGEMSTEITNGAAGITLLWDSSRTLTGTAVAGGYSYVIVNNSGYQLTVSFKDVSQSYTVNQGATQNITLPSPTAIFNFIGGNVSCTISGNTVTFVSIG